MMKNDVDDDHEGVVPEEGDPEDGDPQEGDDSTDKETIGTAPPGQAIDPKSS